MSHASTDRTLAPSSVTMHSLYNYLELKENIFMEHLFFKQLESLNSLSQLAPVAQKMAFWVLSFQDLLELNVRRIQDGSLKKLLRLHQSEDAGHEEWFLHDLDVMNVEAPGIRSLYGEKNTPVRDTTYEILAKVFEARSDHERIAILLTIESAAKVFFSKISGFSERLEASDKLKYFSKKHLAAEESHDSLDNEMDELLAHMWMADDKKQVVHRIVDHVYINFSNMFDHFNTLLTIS
ncbi:hypothetical protein IQ241_13365 [Romeria aff. gracilis LEGE 07310]|uniref:Iron-containing redox enzyme family protein n=1 Tax=Vasconcelosia minhoensis LEGE 07310 TaxID=915328 RepID=A0A8J7AG83_9CYAN|nr:hypothetical protein [Romeria gracilis]MBE9078269.1 hypothetical protein [Romeria aff. gracilis LEGE 07310]